MKNIARIVALSAAALTLLHASPASARTLAAIRADGTLRVATATDIAPFSTFYNGKFVGFEVELMEAVAADMRLKVQFVPANVDELMTMLAEDKVDVGMNVMAITSTRENKVDFTNPTMCTGVSIVANKAGIDTARDLAGRKIVVANGSVMHGFVQKLPFEKQVVVAPTVKDVIFTFLSGQAEATFAFSLQENVLKQMYPKAPMYFSPEVWGSQMGALLRTDSDATRQRINASLKKLMDDGTYARISQKYFGKDIRCK